MIRALVSGASQTPSTRLCTGPASLSGSLPIAVSARETPQVPVAAVVLVTTGGRPSAPVLLLWALTFTVTHAPNNA